MTADPRVHRAKAGDAEPDMSFDLREASGTFSKDGIECPPPWVAGISYAAAALFGLMVWAAVIWWCL